MTATLGIDIASQAKRTAIAAIQWDTPQPVLHALHLGTMLGTPFHDKFLATAIEGLRLELDGAEITKVGIDAPFGWPRAFSDALGGYGAGGPWPSLIDEPRTQFQSRTTDRFVRDRTKRTPLAVSVDKIGYCAMRAATLLGHLERRQGPEVAARDGSGLVCEVYPDPALRHWVEGSAAALGLRQSYKGKGNIATRERLLDVLLEAVPLEDPNELLVEARAAREDDFLDALICAFVARAVELGASTVPAGDEQQAAAAVEGWIHLPTGPLADLFGIAR